MWVARFGESFPIWFAIPRNRLSSDTFEGVCISRRAEVFSGSVVIPVSLIMYPRNFNGENSHFSGLSMAPAACILSRTAVSRASCSV